MHSKIFFILYVALNFSAGTLLGFESQKNIVNDPVEQLDQLVDWFTGEFNNFEQYEEDIYAKEIEGKDITPHYHIHSIFAPIKSEKLGKYVFHVQQSKGDDLTRIFRQRLYIFELNDNSQIELSIYKYKDSEKYLGLHKDLELQTQLTSQDLINTNCKLIWEKNGEEFIARNKDEKCKTYSERFKKDIFVVDSIVLTNNHISILDRIYDSTGKLIMGRADGIPSKLKKCSFFKGWAAIRKDKISHPDTSSKSKYVGYMGLVLHDQGQRAKLIDKDGFDSGYEVSLSQLTYAASNTPVLKLGIHEKGERKTVSYIWGEPEAKRLGLNMKWIQTGFTLVEEERFSK